jgi:hypothetical protein
MAGTRSSTLLDLNLRALLTMSKSQHFVLVLLERLGDLLLTAEPYPCQRVGPKDATTISSTYVGEPPTGAVS